KRYDKRCYNTIKVHNKNDIPNTHQDRKSKNNTDSKIHQRKKQNPPKRNNLEVVILLENEYKERNDELLKLEIEERKALKERSIKARVAEAEARILEAKSE
ncbi:1480_t:CDS:2, partial [Funneliformis caledonium]